MMIYINIKMGWGGGGTMKLDCGEGGEEGRTMRLD